MYTAFNLKLSLNNFKGIDEYIQLGKQQKVEKSEVAKKELDSFILSDTVLDGENCRILGSKLSRVIYSSHTRIMMLI